MVLMEMRRRQTVDPVYAAVPEIGGDDRPAGIEFVVETSRPSVDKKGLAVREFHQGRIALSHIEKCHCHLVRVRADGRSPNTHGKDGDERKKEVFSEKDRLPDPERNRNDSCT